jgi:nucleotide-binding universal stress UspA family protein
MYKRLVVAVDGSPTSDAGLAEAIRIAAESGGTLRLIHVVDELSFAMAMGGNAWGYAGDMLGALRSAGQQVLVQGVAQAKSAGVAAEPVLFDSFAGTVQEMILSETARWKADLIVMGTHGRRGLGRMVLGSSAEQVLRHATVPVLLVREQPAAGDALPAAAVPAAQAAG